MTISELIPPDEVEKIKKRQRDRLLRRFNTGKYDEPNGPKLPRPKKPKESFLISNARNLLTDDKDLSAIARSLLTHPQGYWKGTVSDSDINSHAKMHGVSADELRKAVRREQERYANFQMGR